MGLLILPKRFHPDFSSPKIKPVGTVEVDWNNPLTRGLEVCILFGKPANALMDIGPRRAALTISGSNPQIGDGNLVSNTASDTVDIVDNYDSSTHNTTLVGITRNAVIGGAEQVIFNNIISSNDDGQHWLRFDVTAGIEWRTWNGTNLSTLNLGLTFLPSQGVPANFAFRYDNGIKQGFFGNIASNTATHTAPMGSISTLDINLSMRNNSDPGKLIWRYFYKYNRALSDGEIFSLNNSPYQILKPKTQISYFIPSGNGSISIIVSSLSQTQTIDQPALSQQNQLSVNDIDQLQNIDEPLITQANVLTVNPIDQSQTIDNIVLSVAGALSVDGLDQTQALDLANIIQQHILLVNDTDQSQSLDSPTIQSGTLINVNDIIQAQNLDQSIIIQDHILSVDNLTQSQLIDNVSDGSIVIGYHKGVVSVFSANNGIITVTNSITGVVSVYNATDFNQG